MARALVKSGLGRGIDGAPRDLEVAEGELFAITCPDERWGRSLLRRIAGLEPSRSEIFFGETNVTDVPPEARGVSMVFPSGALYAHLSVQDNIGFGLRTRGVPGPDVKKRVAEVARQMNIEPLLGRGVPALSPAERARVALARGLVGRPSILLLDEPFAHVVGAARPALRTDLLRAHRRFGCTVVLATTDVADALAMGQRVAWVDQGTLRQQGRPLDLYENPADRFVAARVGTPPMNLLTLPVQEGHVQLGEARFPVPPAESIVIGIRPEDLSLDELAVFSVRLPGTVVLSEIAGARALVEVDVGGIRLTMSCDARRVPPEGEEITVNGDLDHWRLFTADEPGVAIPWSFVHVPAVESAAESAWPVEAPSSALLPDDALEATPDSAPPPDDHPETVGAAPDVVSATPAQPSTEALSPAQPAEAATTEAATSDEPPEPSQTTSNPPSKKRTRAERRKERKEKHQSAAGVTDPPPARTEPAEPAAAEAPTEAAPEEPVAADKDDTARSAA